MRQLLHSRNNDESTMFRFYYTTIFAIIGFTLPDTDTDTQSGNKWLVQRQLPTQISIGLCVILSVSVSVPVSGSVNAPLLQFFIGENVNLPGTLQNFPKSHTSLSCFILNCLFLAHLNRAPVEHSTTTNCDSSIFSCIQLCMPISFTPSTSYRSKYTSQSP